MTFTPDEIAGLPADTLVTLTHRTEDGPVQVHHLRKSVCRRAVVLHDRNHTNPVLVWLGSDEHEPGESLWAEFATIWTHDRVAGIKGTWTPDQDALFGRSKVLVRLASRAWTVDPITPAGLAWMRETEPANITLDRLIDQARTVDPALARDLRSVTDRLLSQARAEGAQQECDF